ncbi:heavy metal-associated isoprenylated plant protein 28-like [Rhododendron vialii]|uniref:heavy metal-associated isoprenylated plant protein 28-like n=1 Tax=Rhododendron vialii TaxID=182163 RepID=UPI002660157B|nr:heavy metal-associated isoprenylated plant protein 28-like [Rhododendron vialii]
MTIVEMNVHMDCPGCESKIKKALQKLDGVDDIYIDMAMQKVTVMGCADQRKVLKTVRKTGRMAVLWPFPYNPEYHAYTNYYYDPHLYKHDQGHPTTNYYNQNRYEYQSDPSTYYNQNRYEYQSEASSYDDHYMSQPTALSSYNEPSTYDHYMSQPTALSSYNEPSTYDHRYMSQPAAMSSKAMSSYNYVVHGYSGHDHGYYRAPPHSTILDDKARAIFSDDNTNACSIM